MFYDYICPKCNKIKEVQHGMTENPLIKCPKCSTQMNRRITGGSGVHYKGNGWGGTRSAADSSQAKRVTTTKKTTPIDEY